MTGAESAVLEIDYDEFDFSKTRLAQRQPREARIEFKVTPGAISVRMPASEKASSVVQNLKEKLSRLKKQEISATQIEVVELSPELRTKFFTVLMSKLPDYTYRTVTNVRVSPGASNSDDDDLYLEDEGSQEIKEEILSFVRSVAMAGENLAVSPEYKRLVQGGYFVTSITWHAEHRSSPYHLVRFEAGFENGVEGTGFRYSVRFAPRKKDGEYASTFRSFDTVEREQHLQALEAFARETLKSLVSENGKAEGAAENGKGKLS